MAVLTISIDLTKNEFQIPFGHDEKTVMTTAQAS